MISLGIKTKEDSYRFIFFELRTRPEYYRLCLFASCSLNAFRPLFNFTVSDTGNNPDRKTCYVSICVLFFLRFSWIWNREKKSISDIRFLRTSRKGETK
jgi:hypothetical protein